MNHKEALEVKKALETIGDFIGLDPAQVAKNACLFNDERWKKLKEASKLWNEFQDADIVARGKMLGIEIIQGKGK